MQEGYLQEGAERLKMQRLDFTTLRIFVAVADTRNITRAAELVHIASSAVSKRLSDLEHSLGTTLLYRLPRGVELTPAGEALRHHAQAILNSAERLAADLGDYSSGVKGHVRIAANASSVAEFLPQDLTSYVAEYPEVNIDLQELNTGPVLKAVAEGWCDIGLFAGSRSEYKELHVVPYRADQFVIVVPKDHAFAGRSSMPFVDTLSEYYVGLEAMTAWDSILSKAASDAKGEMKYRFRLKNILSVLRMVSAGLGISVAPLTMVRACSNQLELEVVAISDQWAQRQLSIAVRSIENLTPPARAMFDHLQQRASTS